MGAALLTEKHDGQPLLDILFVHPQWQRKGLATALVSSAINALSDTGATTLESRYMLGNDASQAWHHGYGFKEKPDLMVTRRYRAHARHELWRREQIDDLSEMERQTLLADIQRWEVRVEELEQIVNHKGMEAVLPLLQR
jgi:N-acetylglutamate synthase-like GNAT family acetyltransferase